MIPLLAEVDNSTIGLVVQSLTVLLLLALTALQFFRGVSGKDGERQVEPTANHAVMSELRAQTETLSLIQVDVGVVKKGVDLLEGQMTGMHSRVGSISRDLAGTTARVEGLEKREGHRRA